MTAHRKRERRVPHIDGQFAVLVYLDLTQKEVSAQLQDLQRSYTQRLREGDVKTLVASSDGLGFHISLSKTWYFQKYQLESLVEKLSTEVTPYESFNMLVKVSPLTFFSSSVEKVDEPQDYFGALEVDCSAETAGSASKVLELISTIDRVAVAFGAPTFYTPPRPHVSLFRYASSIAKGVGKSMLAPKNIALASEENSRICVVVNTVWLRVGKAQIRIPLTGTRYASANGLTWPIEKILAYQILSDPSGEEAARKRRSVSAMESEPSENEGALQSSEVQNSNTSDDPLFLFS